MPESSPLLGGSALTFRFGFTPPHTAVEKWFNVYIQCDHFRAYIRPPPLIKTLWMIRSSRKRQIKSLFDCPPHPLLPPLRRLKSNTVRMLSIPKQEPHPCRHLSHLLQIPLWPLLQPILPDRPLPRLDAPTRQQFRNNVKESAVVQCVQRKTGHDCVSRDGPPEEILLFIPAVGFDAVGFC